MPDAEQALIEKIKKDMAKAYKIKTSAIEFHPLMMVDLHKYVGFTVKGLKEGFGREYERIFKYIPMRVQRHPVLPGNAVGPVNLSP
jgi:hypothetical protein